MLVLFADRVKWNKEGDLWVSSGGRRLSEEAYQRHIARLAGAAPTGAKPARATAAAPGDYGEKLPGARKDAAVPTGPRPKKPAEPGAAKPQPRPPWAVPYGVREDARNGKFFVTRGQQIVYGSGGRREFATRKEAEDAIPLIVASATHGVSNRARAGEPPEYVIYRKVSDRKLPTVKGGFKSYEEAQRYLAANPREVLDFKFPSWQTYSYLEKVERTGPTERTGNVGAKEFADRFKFRGVQFGNWQANRDGQTSLNYAYDALNDLSELTGLAPADVSLGGKLGLAFGAQGKGGKGAGSAHYSTAYSLINLTKMKGAGNLGHEWLHALDHYVAKLEFGETTNKLLSEGRPWNKKNPELVDAWNDLVKTLTTKTVTTPKDVTAEQKRVDRDKAAFDALASGFDKIKEIYKKNSRWKELSPEDEAAFTAQLAALERGDWTENVQVAGRGWEVPKPVAELSAIWKRATGRALVTAEPRSSGRQLAAAAVRLRSTRAQLEAARKGASDTVSVRTQYLADARDIDQLRASDYWSTTEELAARAFAAYLEDKAAERGRKTQYLTAKARNSHYAFLDQRPYPDGEERVAINAAFDRLLGTVKKHFREKAPAQPFAERGRRVSYSPRVAPMTGFFVPFAERVKWTREGDVWVSAGGRKLTDEAYKRHLARLNGGSAAKAPPGPPKPKVKAGRVAAGSGGARPARPPRMTAKEITATVGAALPGFRELKGDEPAIEEGTIPDKVFVRIPGGAVASIGRRRVAVRSAGARAVRIDFDEFDGMEGTKYTPVDQVALTQGLVSIAKAIAAKGQLVAVSAADSRRARAYEYVLGGAGLRRVPGSDRTDRDSGLPIQMWAASGDPATKGPGGRERQSFLRKLAFEYLPKLRAITSMLPGLAATAGLGALGALGGGPAAVMAGSIGAGAMLNKAMDRGSKAAKEYRLQMARSPGEKRLARLRNRQVYFAELIEKLRRVYTFAWKEGPRARYWLPDGKDDTPANRLYGARAAAAARAAQTDAKGGKRVGRLTAAGKAARDAARKAKAERVFVPSRAAELTGGDPKAVRADPGAQVPAGLAGGTTRPRAAAAAKGPLPKAPPPVKAGPAAAGGTVTPERLAAMKGRVEKGVVTSRALGWGYDFSKARAALAQASRRVDAYAAKNPAAAVELARKVTGTAPKDAADATRAIKEWLGETLALLGGEPAPPRGKPGAKTMSDADAFRFDRRLVWLEAVGRRIDSIRAVAAALAA